MCVCGGGGVAKERNDETLACGEGGKETEGTQTDRQEGRRGKKRKCAREAEGLSK